MLRRTTFDGPAIDGCSTFLHQLLDFLGSPRSEGGHVTVQDQNQRNEWNDVCEKEVTRRSPEVERGDQKHQNTHGSDGNHGGNGTLLKFENTVRCWLAKCKAVPS